jgi:putative protein-disulfide isomerase
MFTLNYIFDPLCGWCYAISNNLTRLMSEFPSNSILTPSGLFSGSGKRQLTTELANYAWHNDLRIQQITGLNFSENYRKLLYTSNYFDSTYMNRALTLINQQEPTLEMSILTRLQQARYSGGYDTSDASTVATLLAKWVDELSIEISSETLYLRLIEDQSLQQLTALRHKQAETLMLNNSLTGIPTLLKQTEKKLTVFSTKDLLGDYHSLLQNIISQE